MSRSPASLTAFRLKPFVAALRNAMLAFVCGSGTAMAQPANQNTLPTGFALTEGTASPGTVGNDLTVTQNGNFALVDWATFDVGANASVTFNQLNAAGDAPNNAAVIINRVAAGGGVADIFGDLLANGTVAIISPNGVLFGPASNINVGGLIASSLNLTGTPTVGDDDSIAAINLDFDGAAAAGRVENQGTIESNLGAVNDAADDIRLQSVTFIGRGVTNSGDITTEVGGSVSLIGADSATLSFAAPVEGAVRNLSLPTIGTVAAATAPGVAAAVNTGNITANSGTILLQAASSLAAPNGLVPVVNNTGLLVATGVGTGDGGDIQLIGDGGSVQAGGTISADAAGSGTDGSITIVASGADGALSVGDLDAGSSSGTISLTSGADIASVAATTVVASSLTAEAATGIALDTDVDSLSASVSDTGDLTIVEADSITLTSATTFDGGIDVESLTGDITAGTVTAGSNGDVTLNAAAVGGQILDDAPGTADSTRITGNVVTLNATGGVGSGFNTLDGAVDTEAVELVLGVLPGTVNINEASGVTFAFPLSPFVGDFTFRQGAALTVSDFAATNLSLGTVGAFNLTVGLLSGSTVALSSGGSIIDGNEACPALSCTNITATTLLATAATGVDLDTDVSNLTAAVSVAGNLLIRELSGITLTDVSAFNGAIHVTAAGNLIATRAVSSTSSDSNDVVLTSTGGDLTAGTVTATGLGDVTLSATAVGKKIIEDDAGNIGSPTVISGDVVTLQANDGIGAGFDTLDGALDIEAATLSATSSTGAINIDEQTSVTLTALSTSGNITLRAGGALSLPAINVGTNDLALGTTTASGANLTVDGALNADEIRLRAGGSISNNDVLANVVTATGLLTATSGTGVNLDTNVGSLTAVGGSGAVNLSQTGNLLIETVSGASVTLAASGAISNDDAGVDITSDGLLDVTATTGITLDTAVRFLTASSTGGAVNIFEVGDVAINTVGGTSVMLAATGAITDNNGTTTNVTTAGLLSAMSGTGVDLDTVSGSLTAAGGTGTANLSETGDLLVNTVTGADVTLASTGAITGEVGTNVTTSGLLSATSATGVNLRTDIGTLTATGASGDVTISDVGSLALGAISGSNVSVTATGAITDDGNDGALATRVVGGTVTLAAANGIGTLGEDLDIDATSLSAITTTGTININELNALTLTALQTDASDAIALATGDTLTVPFDVTAGTITLNSGGNIATANGAVITADTLNATGDTGVDLDTSVDILSASSGSGAVVIREADDLLVNGVSGTTVTLTTTGGALASGASTVDVTTDGLFTATAATGIDLHTSVGSLAASLTGAGDLAITESDGLSVLSADTANGDVSISTTTGNIVAGTIAAGTGGNVTLSAVGSGGQILDDGNDNDPTTTRIAGNTVTLNADAGIGTALEDVDTDAVTIVATSDTGPINIDELNGATVSASTASDAITLGTTTGDLSVLDVSTAGDVILNAGGSIIGVGAGSDVSAGSLLATAVSGVDLDTDVASLDATVNGPGNIVIDEANGLAVGTIQTGGSLTLNTGGTLSPGSIQANGVTLTTVGELLITNDQQIDGGSGAVVITTAAGTGGISQERGRESPAVLGSSITLNSGGNVGLLTVPLEVDTNGSTIVSFSDDSSQGFISGSFGDLNESGRVLGLASNSELSGVVGAIQSSFEKRVSFNLDSSQFSSSARIFATEGTAVQLPEDQRE